MYRSGPIGRCPIDQLVGQVNRLSASEAGDGLVPRAGLRTPTRVRTRILPRWSSTPGLIVYMMTRLLAGRIPAGELGRLRARGGTDRWRRDQWQPWQHRR